MLPLLRAALETRAKLKLKTARRIAKGPISSNLLGAVSTLREARQVETWPAVFGADAACAVADTLSTSKISIDTTSRTARRGWLMAPTFRVRRVREGGSNLPNLTDPEKRCLAFGSLSIGEIGDASEPSRRATPSMRLDESSPRKRRSLIDRA